MHWVLFPSPLLFFKTCYTKFMAFNTHYVLIEIGVIFDSYCPSFNQWQYLQSFDITILVFYSFSSNTTWCPSLPFYIITQSLNQACFQGILLSFGGKWYYRPIFRAKRVQYYYAVISSRPLQSIELGNM